MTQLKDMSGKALPPFESPGADKLRAYGDLMFLLMRSGRHRRFTMAEVRMAFEPPLELGQYTIFRFDDVPRGMLTWARLSHEAEVRMIRGEPLAPRDWASGDHLWIMDLIAPYRGMAKSVSRTIMKTDLLPASEFFFQRVTRDKTGQATPRRIMRIRKNDSRKATVMSQEEFLETALT